MKGFIVYSTYRFDQENNKAKIYLFGRLKNGENFCTINSYRPYFFVEPFKRIDSDIRYEHKLTKLKNFEGKFLTKITTENPKDVPELRKEFEENDVNHYEADIRFVQRFLIDKRIKGTLDIEGEFHKDNAIDRLYIDPKISPADFTPVLKTLSIDIETNMTASKVFSISLYGKGINEGLIVSQKKLRANTFETEKLMLEYFREKVVEYDPDIITGWNVVGFDLDVLRNRFKHFNIPFHIGRNDWACRIRKQESFFRDSTADIPGRMVLDGIHLMKISFIKLQDYKLDTAAQTILGDEKLKVFDNDNKGEEIQRLFKDEPQKLVDYNIKDSKLVIDILKAKGLIEMTIQRSILTGMPLDRVNASIASLDSLYLRETLKRGVICKTSKYQERTSRITGGYVKDSAPGIYDNIYVLDFKSLYPSIIRTFNIDPLMFIGKTKDKHYIIAPNGAGFKREDGILPILIQRLWTQRDKAKKKNNQEESYAIKITMNSFFGVLANPNCRFYSLDMANAITYFGRFIVQKTAEIVEKKGMKVIYGDTDSIFVAGPEGKDNKKLGEKISKEVNDFWSNHVKKEFNRESFLELQFEKTYTRFIMPMIRGTNKGAKKRYAGIKIVDGKEKIDFVGLEMVRRDWTDLAKTFQKEVLWKIFHKEEVTEYIQKFVKDIQAGKKDDLLIYRKAIRKKLDAYTKITPPHVKAARKLGKLKSNIITYYMTVEGPEPVEKLEHKIDYDHYIEKQVKPIADSILVFYDQSFDELLNCTSQTNLFSFE